MRSDQELGQAQRRRTRWPLAASLLVLCCCALALLWRPVLLGEVFLPMDTLLHLHPWRYSYERVPVHNPGTTDPIKQVYPRRILTNDMIRQGALPLWNSSVVSGVSNLADGQLGLFYPPTWLLALLPLSRAFGFYALMQVALAGIGCFVFARGRGLGYTAAVFTGASYMLNGYLMKWLYFPHHSGAIALLPWCFWSVDRAWARGRWADWSLVAVVCALPVFTHIQLALYFYLGLGAYMLARILAARRRRAWLRPALGFSGAALIALAVSAVQLLPALELSAGGQRQNLEAAVAPPQDFALNLIRLALPIVGGIPRDGPTSWGPAVIIFPPPYTGIAPLLLAGAALLLARRRAVLFFAALAIAAFALATSSALIQILSALVPPYRQFEDHTRWFTLWYFAIAILAGFGMQELFDRRRASGDTPRSLMVGRVLFVLLGMTLAVSFLWQLQLFTPQSRYGAYITLIRQQPQRVSLVVTAVALGLLALLVVRRGAAVWLGPLLIGLTVFDLLWFCGSNNVSFNLAQIQPTADLVRELPADVHNDQIFPITRQIAFLQQQPGPFRIHGGDYETLPPNLAGAFGLEDIRGYLSLYSERYNRLARLIDGKDYSHTGESNVGLRSYLTSAYKHRRLLDMLNVKYFVFTPGSKNPALYAPLQLVQQNDEGSIYYNPQSLPRAFLVHRIAVLADDDAQLDRLARPDFDPATTALLPTAVPAVVPPDAAEPVPSVSYAPNRATVRASVRAPALLVLADAYDDGWQASVDGQLAPVYRADYALRGVWLPAGDHTVEFVYRPRALVIGGVISLIGVFILIGTWIWSKYRDQRTVPEL
jgi:hypothetical protein